MQLPVNPVEKIASVVEGGPDGMAERLLRTFLGAWDPHRDVFSTLVRTTLGSGDGQAPMLAAGPQRAHHLAAERARG